MRAWMLVCVMVAVAGELSCEGHAQAGGLDKATARGPLVVAFRSGLSARLVATFHEDDVRRSRALLRSGTHRVLLRRGQRWRDYYVVAIASGRVLLWRQGARSLEFLAFGARGKAALDQPSTTAHLSGVEKRGAGRFRVSRRLLEEVAAQPHRFSRGVRISADRRGGFTLHRLAKSHPLAALGLRRGDRLSAINGRALRGFNDVVSAYGALRHARHLAISVVRGKERLTLAIEVE